MKLQTIFNALISAVLLCSCHGFVAQSPEAAPVDEATQEERAQISQTLEKISTMAAQYGYHNKFESIPVIVVSETAANSGHLGTCHQVGDHKGLFITINRENFEQDNADPKLQRVFAVLLHEIGHCYLGKDHSTELITKPGYHLKIEISDAHGGSDHDEEGLPTSIMYVGKRTACHGACPEASSIAADVPELQNYYVAELFAGVALKSADDITQFKKLQWVPFDGQQ